MKSENDMPEALNVGSTPTSATPSLTALNRKLGRSPTPRMLTPFEIDLLRKSKAEVMRVTHEVLAAGLRARASGQEPQPQNPKP